MSESVKVLPNNTEAERAVLGSILLDATGRNEDRVLDLCGAKNIHDESFYDPRNRTIFHVMGQLKQLSKPVDMLTVVEKLRNDGELDGIGGVGYIQGLIDNLPSASHAEYYLDILRDKQLRRTMIDRARKTIEKCFDEAQYTDPQAVLGDAEKSFLEIGANGGETMPWSAAVQASFDKLNAMFSSKGNNLDGLSTYVNGALNNTSYWKRDRFYYDKDHEKSDTGQDQVSRRRPHRHQSGGHVKHMGVQRQFSKRQAPARRPGQQPLPDGPRQNDGQQAGRRRCGGGVTEHGARRDSHGRPEQPLQLKRRKGKKDGDGRDLLKGRRRKQAEEHHRRKDKHHHGHRQQREDAGKLPQDEVPLPHGDRQQRLHASGLLFVAPDVHAEQGRENRQNRSGRSGQQSGKS